MFCSYLCVWIVGQKDPTPSSKGPRGKLWALLVNFAAFGHFWYILATFRPCLVNFGQNWLNMVKKWPKWTKSDQIQQNWPKVPIIYCGVLFTKDGILSTGVPQSKGPLSHRWGRFDRGRFDRNPVKIWTFFENWKLK